jgi:hypothetical protein
MLIPFFIEGTEGADTPLIAGKRFTPVGLSKSGGMITCMVRHIREISKEFTSRQ